MANKYEREYRSIDEGQMESFIATFESINYKLDMMATALVRITNLYEHLHRWDLPSREVSPEFRPPYE